MSADSSSSPKSSSSFSMGEGASSDDGERAATPETTSHCRGKQSPTIRPGGADSTSVSVPTHVANAAASGSSAGPTGDAARQVSAPRPKRARVDGELRRRVDDVRRSLEEHRLRGDGGSEAQGGVARLLTELEALDRDSKLSPALLRVTKIGVELNRGWWRRKVHGPVAVRAAALVIRWMNKASATVAERGG